MRSERVISGLSRLRAATDRLEVARPGDDLAHAIAERADAVERVASIISRDKRAFAVEDLAHLRELYLRGDAVLSGMKRARRDTCATAARLDQMRRVVSSFSPSA